jgi:hypothetical protein
VAGRGVAEASVATSAAAGLVNDPPAPEAAAADAAPADAASVPPEGEAGPTDAAAPGRPILRLRSRRRRRRRPAAPGLLPGPVEDAASPVPTSDQASGESGVAAAAIDAPRQRAFSAPRRRRRQAPLSAAEGAAGDGTTATPAAEPALRPPRSRNRRRRRAAPPGAAAGENAAGASETHGPRPHRERRGNRDSGDTDRPASPPRGERNRDRRRDGPPGRGRHDGRRGREGPRRVERKLYTLDAVVDRGFDDVEEEAGTRRVHWTIVKRTTADQVSRKAISAVYVLQRDGTDSEFPSLGAARDAVNKTIVHPEKLTRSKAEHAAERGGGKK